MGEVAKVSVALAGWIDFNLTDPAETFSAESFLVADAIKKGP